MYVPRGGGGGRGGGRLKPVINISCVLHKKIRRGGGGAPDSM